MAEPSSMGRTRVLTLTSNPAIDVALAVDALVPDHKLRARSASREAGGGGVNVARVLRRLGVNVDACVVAAGATGDELVTLIEAESVSTIAITVSGLTRESISITDSAGGRQYRIVVDGPIIDDPDGLSEAVVRAADGAGLVVLSGSQARGLPVGFSRSMAAGLGPERVIVDCSGDALAEVISGSAFLVKPSRRELASMLTWTPVTSGEIEIGAREVLARGQVEHLVVSLGPRGAMLVPREADTVWFTVPHVEVKSTVGAGDSMVAGIVSGLVDQLDVASAVRRGVAAGTATATSSGTALCDASLVEQLEPLVGVSIDNPW